jgi:hypothetical protein
MIDPWLIFQLLWWCDPDIHWLLDVLHHIGSIEQYGVTSGDIM